MKQKLLLLIFGFFFPLSLHAQSLSLTIQSGAGTILSGSPGNLRINLGLVDALGISPNPMGEARYDPSRRGAFYDVALDLITESNTGNGNLELSVLRSHVVKSTDFPRNALYDADYAVRFGEGSEIHEISDTTPYIIRSDLPSNKTLTRRKIGVFISEKLPPGQYEGSLIYTLTSP
ncbi:MAG: hypothetical protein JNK65_01995 [Deltaproteobacteria bacterium]|nr:hypothetical protein [Deltaproteobacteria bacterium]